MGANRTIADLMTQGANAQASGIVGAANAQQSALNTGINTALGIATLGTLGGGFGPGAYSSTTFT
jgi:hypothetical protein